MMELCHIGDDEAIWDFDVFRTMKADWSMMFSWCWLYVGR
jgi:hypothetical protein